MSEGAAGVLGRLPAALRGAGVVGGGTMVAAVLGLVFQSLISYHFGAGAETDAYFMSLVIFGFCSKLAMLTQFKSVALPLYRQRLDSGAEAARELAGRLLVAFTAAVAGFTLLLVLGAPLVVDVLAPGFRGETRELTVALLRVRLPALAVLGATTVALTVLEATRRFGAAVSIQKVVPAATGVALLAAVTDRFGIMALAWIGLAGTVGGGVLAWIAVRNLVGGRGAWRAWRDADVRGLARSWLRLGSSNVATLVGEWAFRVAASLLPVGFFSGVLYGRMVHDLLHGAINDSAQAVALPRFAEVAGRGGGRRRGAGVSAGLESGGEGVGGGARGADPLGRALLGSLRSLSAVSLPVALFAMLAAPRIVGLLFGRGRFLEDGMVGPASVALAIFCVGFVVQGLNQLAFSAAFAAGLSGLVNRVQVVGHLFRAAILIPLVLGFSYVGLVGGQVLMNLLVLGLLAAWAPRSWGLANLWAGGRLLRGTAGKLLLILAGQVALFAVLDGVLPGALEGGIVTRAMSLGVLGAVWFAVYLLVGWVLGLDVLGGLHRRV